MSRSKIIERIHKLLALAKSSNVNEAAVAAAHAQRLIERHRIEQAALIDAVQSEISMDEDALDEGARMAQWKLELAMVVAEANGCRVVVLKDGRYSTINLVGGGEDITIVRALYTWLTTEVQRLARTSKLRGRDRLDAFRLGAITTIEQRLLEATIEARKHGCGARNGKAPATSTALVRAGVQALVWRDNEAERVADEICEGREESLGEHGAFDVEAWVNGAASANTVDLTGHQTKLGRN